jgi:hypothetical protein
VLYYARVSWCNTIGLKQILASMAGRFLNLIPSFGLAAAYLFLGERLTVVQWIGGVIIVPARVAMLPWQDATIVHRHQSHPHPNACAGPARFRNMCIAPKQLRAETQVLPFSSVRKNGTYIQE